MKYRVRDYLNYSYKLDRVSNAFVACAVVGIGLWLMFSFQLGLLGALLIVAAQSVAGINAHNLPLNRLTISLKVSCIYLLVLLIAICSRDNLLYISLAMVMLAYLFSFLKQYYPINWPDIVIPAAALFLMSHIAHEYWPCILYTFLGCLLGVTVEILIILGLIMYGKRYTPMIPLATNEKNQINKSSILGLKEANGRYALEMALLLVASGLLMYFSPFPHSYWAPLTIIMVVQVGNQGAFKRISQRILGTLVGCSLGALLLHFATHVTYFVLAIIVCVYFWQYYIRQNYMVGSAFVTAFVLILLGMDRGNPIYLAVERLSFSTLGGVMALGSSWLFAVQRRVS